MTNCGRLCLYRKKINLSTCLAGQAVGIKEMEDGIWLVSFVDYDLSYTDLDEKTSPSIIPSAKSVTHVLGMDSLILVDGMGFECASSTEDQ